jgi:hypothetical protein
MTDSWASSKVKDETRNKHKLTQQNIVLIAATILDIIHRPVFYLKLNSTL